MATQSIRITEKNFQHRKFLPTIKNKIHSLNLVQVDKLAKENKNVHLVSSASLNVFPQNTLASFKNYFNDEI